MAIKPMDIRSATESVDRRLEELAERALMSSDWAAFTRSPLFARLVEEGRNPFPASTGREFQMLLEQLGRGDQSDWIDEQIADLPDHLGSKALVPHPVRVAIIADQFFYKSVEGVADFVPLHPDSWWKQVGEVDMLLITSAWRGLDNEWFGLSRQSSIRNMLATQIVPTFRQAGVPVVFYSKEDPPNFSVFLPLAKLADHVVTSAESRLPEYQKACPRAQTFGTMSFGVNPLHHNPVGSRRRRLGQVLFAGSWHRHKYQTRRTAGAEIFRGVREAGRELLIFDRNFDSGLAKYAFPHEFLDCMAPAISHERLLKLQRVTDVSINLNSVIGSMTMYANRAVELQAMGAYVLSNYNAGINDRFPSVFIAEGSIDVRDQLLSLDPEAMYRAQMAGLRTVYSGHTAHQHFGQLLEQVGLPVSRRELRVAACGDPGVVERFVGQQSLSTIMPMDVGQLARAAELADIVIPVDEDINYGFHYAEDLVNGFRYTDSEFVTKSTSLRGGQIGSSVEHDRVTEAAPALAAIWTRTEAFERYRETDQLSGTGYAVDPFEFALAGGGDSTLVIEPEFEDAETAQPRATSARLTVVVPVYNNGRYLRDKCIASLRRSTLFDDMEILLVDDGSTDPETVDLLGRLSHGQERVRWLRNAPGGSGSASRPRNQGLAAASAPYVTYLDPDNEAVNDGYARLLELIEGTELDFVIGNMSKLKGQPKYVPNAEHLLKHLEGNEDGSLTPMASSLPAMRFAPMSIQALIANTEWLRSLGITQPVGAVGQDSYFFQQMLYYAKRIRAIKLVIHVYYAAVSTSTVNTISPNFFRKYLPLERSRSTWLKKIGLIEDYRRTRFEPFLYGWHYPRLKMVAPEERDEALAILREINEMYEFADWSVPELKELFAENQEPAAEEATDGKQN